MRLPTMPEISIVYWRDIPAQVIVGKGRRAAKIQLPERFERAIDRCAMKTGAKDTDSYLSEWRKGTPRVAEGDPSVLAETESERLRSEYDSSRLSSLIENGGWEQNRGDAAAPRE